MSDECWVGWFHGLACDHLYADCPSRRRAETQLRRAGWWFDEPRTIRLDAHGGDVCGLCLHRHNRTHHRESA